jgi:hypothetical protein
MRIVHEDGCNAAGIVNGENRRVTRRNCQRNAQPDAASVLNEYLLVCIHWKIHRHLADELAVIGVEEAYGSAANQHRSTS